MCGEKEVYFLVVHTPGRYYGGYDFLLHFLQALLDDKLHAAPFSFISDKRWYGISGNGGTFSLLENTVGDIIGLSVSTDPNRVLMWRRGVPPISVRAGHDIDVECLRMCGFPAHDTKQGLIVSGIGSASSSCPCLGCTMLSSSFHLYPKWMGDMDSLIPQEQCMKVDPPLQHGENSNLSSNIRKSSFEGLATAARVFNLCIPHQLFAPASTPVSSSLGCHQSPMHPPLFCHHQPVSEPVSDWFPNAESDAIHDSFPNTNFEPIPSS